MINHRHSKLVLHLVLAACLVTAATALAEDLAIGRFSREGLTGWEPKSFKGLTAYHLVQENGKTVVKATSHAAASGLVRKVSFDPHMYRYLRWSWKVGQTITGGDEKSKAGDDYAARVYVVFTGRYFWQIKAINYIWANKLPKGEAVASPYATDSKMVAVESGNRETGRWVNEERDLLADYRRLFGENPHEAEAIAIMTDTDNTGSSAEAWYGDITISTEH